jgi:hypothetical protein
VALNTVKRYARMPEPHTSRIAPTYRPTLVDPYRDHLRARRAADPAVPVTRLLAEIRESGYTGSANLLVRYLNQGRAEGDRPVTTSRHAGSLLLTRPENPAPEGHGVVGEDLRGLPGDDLTRRPGARLRRPADTGRGQRCETHRVDHGGPRANLPHLRSFTNGLEIDRSAVTLPYHNGRTEGVNTRTKRIMRQMHGRAGFDLLGHRILLP